MRIVLTKIDGVTEIPRHETICVATAYGEERNLGSRELGTDTPTCSENHGELRCKCKYVFCVRQFI